MRRPLPRPERIEVGGVSLSHPDREIWPDDHISKVELARYYQSIAKWIVPQVAGRPLTVVRCPGTIDECAYMRHLKVWGPAALRRIEIPEKRKRGQYLVAEDLEGVISLVQMDIVEIHTWNSTLPEIEHPDRIVIDLDPDETVAWREVARTAFRVRERLGALDLDSFVKSTGGKGLHVVAPLVPRASWQECLDFSRALCASLEREEPERLTLRMARAQRGGKILLDYLRNNRGNSSVAAFSTRARPGAPVSVTLGWDEIERPPRFSLRGVKAFLAGRRDPWAGYGRARGRITPAMTRALSALGLPSSAPEDYR